MDGFFDEADPIRREAEGPGVPPNSFAGMGNGGGLVGGVLFGLLLTFSGGLRRVVPLAGGTSLVAAFLIHLLVSAVIGGMSYGLFFRREALNWQSSLGWGLL